MRIPSATAEERWRRNGLDMAVNVAAKSGGAAISRLHNHNARVQVEKPGFFRHIVNHSLTVADNDDHLSNNDQMVPPRQSTSTIHIPPQPSTISAMSTPTATLGMSPAARYNHNLRVLRKRDPSITSIFDQFSHVAVYHHDGKSWKKNGYEGSMFLFER